MQFHFSNARLRALHHWLYETGRVLVNNDGEILSREHVSNGFECKWQIKNEDLHFGTKKEDNHISLFCSLGSWASHITDILGDIRFDLINLPNGPIKDEEEDEAGKLVEYDIHHYELLARHYERFFLVASEMLVDFLDFAKLLNKKESGNIFESDLYLSYRGLRGFINKALKHKTKNLHKCNHHIPFIFDDGNIYDSELITSSETYYIKVGCSHEYDLKNIEYILVYPKLIEVVKLLTHCYKVIDELIDDDAIMEITKEYGDKY